MDSLTNTRFPEFDFSEGEILLIDKPLTWTSFDVVGKIRNSIKPLKVKVGHAGTLDPLASGLLVLCTGKKTKIIDSLQSQEKEYTGTFYLAPPPLRTTWKRKSTSASTSLISANSKFSKPPSASWAISNNFHLPIPPSKLAANVCMRKHVGARKWNAGRVLSASASLKLRQ